MGCPIYAEDCGNARGTLGFFVKSRIGHGTYFITNAHVTNFLECIDCNTGKYIFQEVPQVLPSKKVLHPSETALEVKRAELARLRKNSWGIKRRYLNSRIKELDEAPKNVLGHVVFSFFGFRTDPIDERRRFADFSVVQISEDRVAAANKLVYDVSREETVTFSNNLSFSKLSYAGTPRNGRFDDQGLFTSVVLERSNNVSLDEDTKSTLVGLAGSNKIPSLSCQILAEENCCMTFFPGENRPVWSWALSSVCVATTGTFIAASDQGDSGSVLFDSFGKILGIVFGRTISSSGDPPLTLFMDIDIIRSLIDVTYEIA